MQKIEQLLGEVTPFLDKIFDYLKADSIHIQNYELDHICYRVANIRRYQDLKMHISSLGELLTESLINGRPIATFKLKTPIIYHNRKIYLLELPSPKTGSLYKEGFEHVEFVIDENLDNFIKKYPTINFDTKGMKKVVNPDIRVKYDDLSVKFHQYNLEYVIKYLD